MPGEAYQSAVQRVKDLQAQGFNIKPPSEQETVNFREKVFNPFMENIVNNLEGRFPDLPLIQKFEVFNTRKFPDDNSTSHGEEDIKVLAEHFGLVVDKTLHEWRQVRESIADSGLAADKAMEWVTINLKVSHTNLFKLAAVGLLIPTSTSDCERGFSTLKRVKTTHRASLSPPVLNAILTVGMLGPAIEKVYINAMVKIWHKEKPRCSQL
ncbi:zinc finger protein 862-like [Ruditapes philippinarum]|uniref:zinc finger protein 862-like n=1 Tax=Ruditapes philippinarum TaxID=129788 RepID=UPI00295BCA1C|nr:zinc finger protein 862-like [Ruditapes philippinarum]